MGLEVRRVHSAADFARLAEYRYRVYVEDLRLLDAAAAGGRRRLVDDLDEVSTSYAVLDGDEVVGSLRFTHLPDVAEPRPLADKFAFEDAVAAFGAEAICTTSRFIVEEGVRRSRAMLRMMELCYEDAARLGVRLNYGDTSPGLLLFYEHMGYRRYTRPWNDPVYGFKLPILMLGRDRDWLRRVRSPLHRVALRRPPDPEARAWFEAAYAGVVECESAPFQRSGGFRSGLERCLRRELDAFPGLLRGLAPAELGALLARASLFDVVEGDRILRRGERVPGLLLAARGRLVAHAPDGSAERFAGGDVVGDLAGRFVHGADSEVLAATDGSLLVLPAAHLEHLLAGRDDGLDRLRSRLAALIGPADGDEAAGAGGDGRRRTPSGDAGRRRA